MEEGKGRELMRESALLGLLLLLLVPVELLCAQAAFETIGEISRGLYWVLAIAGNCVVILTAVRSRAVAGTLALLLGLAIIPYEIVLMHRHARVQTEAARIVAYAYETKLDTGEYPTDLSGYVYEHPETSRFIQGYHAGSQHGGFQVVYRVGTESTSHWYSPKDGWSYYPD
ncbi:hypothetical protein ACFL09_01840 [Planctomycetota bacterium]